VMGVVAALTIAYERRRPVRGPAAATA
jgi:hypothetical protein